MDTALATLLLQTKQMRAYVDAYGDFVLTDGTHGLNRYKLIAIVFTLIDCLGKSVTPGFAFDHTENTNIGVEAATRFGFVQPCTAFMSDRAPAFAALAEIMAFIHVLCAWHYQKNLLTAAAGLPQLARNMYIECINELIFNHFNDEAALANHFARAREYAASVATAVKFVNKMYSERQKICLFYTKNVFTCGHSSTVRSESKNSLLKGGGTLKKELSETDLVGSFERIMACFDRQEQESLALLCKLIEQGKHWSDFVDKEWQKRHRLSDDYQHVSIIKQDNHCTLYLVMSDTHNYIQHDVAVFADGRPPECSCHHFKHMKIPCEGICATFGRRKESLFQVKHLCKRWRLDSHPLYRKALVCKGIDPGDIIGSPDAAAVTAASDSSNDATMEASAFVFPKSALDKVHFPPRSNVRHAALDAQAKSLIDLAKSNKCSYQFLTVVFSCLENQLKEMNKKGSSGALPLTLSRAIVVPVRAPLSGKKRARPSDLVNHAKHNPKNSSNVE
jgi:hypothetical protein